MSIASKITDLNNLKNRIRTKLINLGLMSSSDPNGLDECTEVLENEIDEHNVYSISSSGVVDVVRYKYAQIDQTAWVPAGTTPSGLVSVVTYLGENGIERTAPTNTSSIGTVYPPSGALGIAANNIQIDTDVIKPQNIKSGVTILGVQGTASGGSIYANRKRVVGRTITEAGQSIPSTTVLVDTVTPPTGYAGMNPVQIYRDNTVIKPENIKSGVTIMGVNGSYTGSSALVNQGLTLGSTPNLSNGSYTLSPPSGYDGFSSVAISRDSSIIKPENIVYGKTILGVTGTTHNPSVATFELGSGMPSTATPTAPRDCFSEVRFTRNDTIVKPENIKSGVTILGVTGNYSGSSTPSGTRYITDTNATDVSTYQYAQVVDNDLAAWNIKSGVTILGVTGTYEFGNVVSHDYYELTNSNGDVNGLRFSLSGIGVSGLAFSQISSINVRIYVNTQDWGNNGIISILLDRDYSNNAIYSAISSNGRADIKDYDNTSSDKPIYISNGYLYIYSSPSYSGPFFFKKITSGGTTVIPYALHIKYYP